MQSQRELQGVAAAVAGAVEKICARFHSGAPSDSDVLSSSASDDADACTQQLKELSETLENALAPISATGPPGEQPKKMPAKDVDQLRSIWASSLKLWNCCVSEANNFQDQNEKATPATTNPKGNPPRLPTAEMRDVACRFLLIVTHQMKYQIPDQGIDYMYVVAEALIKTGRVWHELGLFERSEELYKSAADILHLVADSRWEPRCTSMSLECALARMTNLWALQRPEAAHKVEGPAIEQALVVAGMSALGVSGAAMALHVALSIYNRAAAVSHAETAEGRGHQGSLCWPDRNSESLRMLEECQQVVDAVLNGPLAGSLSAALVRDARALKREALMLMAGYLVDRQSEGDIQIAKRCLQILKNEYEGSSEGLPCTAQVAGCLVSLSSGEVSEAMTQMMEICNNPNSQPNSVASIIIHALRTLRQRPEMKADNMPTIRFAAQTLQAFCQPAQGNLLGSVNPAAEALPAARVAIHILTEGHMQDGDEEALALDISRWEAAGISFILADALWNRGVQHFRSKRFDKAEPCFYAAAEHYSGRGLGVSPSALQHEAHTSTGKKTANLERAAKSMSTAALCCIGRGAPADAVRLLGVSEKLQPGLVSSTFMCLKALLQLNDSKAAAEQVTRLPSCVGFELEHLRLACQEAQSARMPDVALAALLSLQSELQQSPPDKYDVPGSLTEGAVLRATVQLLTERTEKACSKLRNAGTTIDGDDDLKNAVSALDQLGSVMNLACKRLSDLGPSRFHGKAAGGKTANAQSEWFARSCWNNAMDAQQYATQIGSYVTWQCCATLWRASACFLCSSQAADAASLQKDHHQGKVAYLQAAAAAMEAFKLTVPADGELRAQALDLVQGLLDQLEEIIKLEIKQPLEGANLLVFHYLRFCVAVGRKDTASIASLLRAAAEIPSATAGWLWCYTTLMNSLLKQAGDDAAAIPPASLTSLVKMALHLILQKLVGELGSSASAELPKDAANLFHRTLRWLLNLSLNDQENAKLYGQAADLLETHRSLSQSHSTETNRLVAQAHNRGIELALQARVKESEDHLQAALRISTAAAGSKPGQADHIRKTLRAIRTSASVTKQQA